MPIITSTPPFAGTQVGDKTVMANQMPGLTNEAKITTATSRAKLIGALYVYISANMLPFDITKVTMDSSVRYLCEGGDSTGYDVRAYGAANNGTGDDSPSIQAAHDNMPLTGGELVLGKNHRIATSVTFSKHVHVNGQGATETPGNSVTPTLLTKASSLNAPAIIITGSESLLERFVLEGENGNGGDGIAIRAHSVGLRNVSVYHQGNDGIRVNQNSPSLNTNSFRFDRVVSNFNIRHGIFVDDTLGGSGPNANAGSIVGCETAGNGADGLKIDNGRFNTIVGHLSEVNTGIGVHFASNSRWNLLVGGDLQESNVGGDLVVDAGAIENTIWPALNNATTSIVDNGTGTHWIFQGRQNRLAFRGASAGSDVTSFADGDATPSVAKGTYFQVTNTTPTTITDFTNGVAGQLLIIRLNNQTSITHNSALIRLRGALSISATVDATDANMHIVFIRLAGIWFELCRTSPNSNNVSFGSANGVTARVFLNQVGVRLWSVNNNATDGEFRISDETTPAVRIRINGTTGLVTVGKGLASGQVNMGTGNNFTPDASAGNSFLATVNNNATFNAPTNPTTGQRIVITVIQDATGGRTATFNAVFKFVWSDVGNTLSKRSSIAGIYDGTNWNQDGAQTPYV